MRNRFLIAVLVLVCLGGLVVFAKSQDFLSNIILAVQGKPVAQTNPLQSSSSKKVQSTVSETGGMPQTTPTPDTPPPIPEKITWFFLFRQLAALEDRAREAESKGEDGSPYRTLYKRSAGLSDGENSLLMATAISCMAALEAKNAEAQQVSDQIRAQKPPELQSNTPTGSPTPIPQLVELQSQRDEIVMGCRQDLQDGFGTDFERFENVVHSKITSNITSDLRRNATSPPMTNRNLASPGQARNQEENR